MALTEIQRLRTFNFDVKLSVSHAAGIGVWKSQVTEVCFVFLGQFDIVWVDQLRK
jgi:hypothetical protein